MSVELKPCPLYHGRYFCDSNGNIYNKNGYRLSPYDNGYGYLIVDLRNGRKKKHEKVHRLIALAFVPNPYGLPEVNHKDENKHNNSASNLEWCTSGYNKTYGSGRKARSDGMKLVWKRRRAET